MEEILQLESEVREALKKASSVQDSYALKTTYLGSKSKLVAALKGLRNLSAEEKISKGKYLNEIKEHIERLFAEHLEKINRQKQLSALGDIPDLSLPSPDNFGCSPHPLTQIQDKILAIFSKLGYSIMEGPEIDTEWFCFDALNVPENHPARNEQDTFFLPSQTHVNVSKHGEENYLLRTHTSTVQVRTLLKNEPPLRIVSPGRVFRRDTVDATHNFNFHQIEILCVEEGITVADLKGTIDHFVHSFFGKNFKTRLRPSFFPFTEPSYEVDIFVPQLGNFKNRWIEVWGCGMVNPKVFDSVGYDNNKWQGFAFGMGVERLAMLLYAVEDIRRFYTNDVRFLRQF